MSSVNNDGRGGFSLWNLCCCCCKEDDPIQEPLMDGQDSSINQYGTGTGQRQDRPPSRPRTPDSAFGRQTYRGEVTPPSPTHTTEQSKKSGSDSEEEEIERSGTPDSAYGRQTYRGEVTSTSPQRHK